MDPKVGQVKASQFSRGDYCSDVNFGGDDTAFTSFSGDSEPVELSTTYQGLPASAQVTFIKQPDPYIGKLRFGTEYEQNLWSECSRLIANCIIYYNATRLSHLLAHKESRGDMQVAALVKQASAIAWQHINLYGRTSSLNSQSLSMWTKSFGTG